MNSSFWRNKESQRNVTIDCLRNKEMNNSYEMGFSTMFDAAVSRFMADLEIQETISTDTAADRVQAMSFSERKHVSRPVRLHQTFLWEKFDFW